MRYAQNLALALAAVVLGAGAALADADGKPVLTLEVARRVAAAAALEAAKDVDTGAIAIVDDGGHLVFIWWVHDDDRPGMENLLKNTLEHGNNGHNVEFKGIRKDGSIWYGSQSWEPIKVVREKQSSL